MDCKDVSDTSVALFVFNRPDTTRRVFEAIASLQPARLLLIADGARPGKAGEAKLCQQVRDIVSQVNWPCEVSTNFAENNLGCGERMISGLDWVFSLVEEAILLEDDCLPHPTFFPLLPGTARAFSRRQPSRLHLRRQSCRQVSPHRGQLFFFRDWRYLGMGNLALRMATVRPPPYGLAQIQEPEVALRNLFTTKGRRFLEPGSSTRCTKKDDAGHLGLSVALYVSQKSLAHGSFQRQSHCQHRLWTLQATHTTSEDARFMLPANAIEFPLTHPVSFVPCGASIASASRTCFRHRSFATYQGKSVEPPHESSADLTTRQSADRKRGHRDDAVSTNHRRQIALDQARTAIHSVHDAGNPKSRSQFVQKIALRLFREQMVRTLRI